eukprot:3757745-Rhodomonas_salina.1
MCTREWHEQAGHFDSSSRSPRLRQSTAPPVWNDGIMQVDDTFALVLVDDNAALPGLQFPIVEP